MTGQNRDLAAVIRQARSALSGYGTGTGTARTWAPVLADRLRDLLAAIDTVPADVDQAVRDTLALHQALDKLPGIYRSVLENPGHPTYRARCRIAAKNLAALELPPDLHEARDTVLAALRQGGDR